MILDHLILSLENNFEGLKEEYEKKDSEKFNEFKRLILQTQKENL